MNQVIPYFDCLLQGHAVGNMISGGHGGRDEVVAAGTQYPNQQQMEQQQQQYKNPCEFEWKQFLEWSVYG